jgi:hypothetical protein
MPTDAAGNPVQPAVAGTPPAPQPTHPDFNRPPAAAGEARPATIYMESAAYQAMMDERAELIQFKARAQQEFEAKEAERLAALAKAGKIEEALTETRNQGEIKHREAEQRYQALESAWLTEKKNAAIAEALNGRQFVGDPARTAALVRRYLADEIEATRDSQGNPVVYDRKTRRPAADYLKERLESPDSDLAPLLAASHRGGAGTDGTRTAGAPGNEDPTSAYMKQFREQMAASRSDPTRVYG